MIMHSLWYLVFEKVFLFLKIRVALHIAVALCKLKSSKMLVIYYFPLFLNIDKIHFYLNEVNNFEPVYSGLVF